MHVWFWQKWVIRYAMRKLKQLSPVLGHASYARLNTIGVADVTESENGETWILPR